MEETSGKPAEAGGSEIVPVSAAAQPAPGAEVVAECAPRLSRADELLLTIGGKVVFAFVAALGLVSLGVIAAVVYLCIRWYIEHARFW